MRRAHRFDARCAWAASLGAMGALVVGCRQPDAPRAPPARPQAQAEAAPAAESTRAAVLACVPTPALVPEPGCSMHAASGAAPVACADLSPAGSPEVVVLSLVVARSPYDFSTTLGVPSMMASLDGRGPEFQGMARVYRDFEGPHVALLADGRRVPLEARGLMLGGVVRWSTLASPRASFTTVLVQQIPLHDAPLADADRAAIEGWDLVAMIACVDGRFWPRSSRP